MKSTHFWIIFVPRVLGVPLPPPLPLESEYATADFGITYELNNCNGLKRTLAVSRHCRGGEFPVAVPMLAISLAFSMR